MSLRFVKTGKETFYLGKTLGNIYADKYEIKGSPVVWVNTALTKHNKDQLTQIVSKLAKEEITSYGTGKKMKGSSFWRNAYSYLKNL